MELRFGVLSLRKRMFWRQRFCRLVDCFGHLVPVLSPWPWGSPTGRLGAVSQSWTVDIPGVQVHFGQFELPFLPMKKSNCVKVEL